LVVLDVDGEEGRRTLARLQAEHGDFPDMPRQTTGRGFHYFFRHSGPSVRIRSRRIAEGLDVKADGGCVVGPGSVHATGAVYAWVDGLSPDNVPLADLPGWFLDLLTSDGGDDEVVVTGEADPLDFHEGLWRDTDLALEMAVEDVASVSEGERNTTLNHCAFKLGQLVGTRHLEEQEVVRRLLQAARRSGLGRSEALSAIRSGLVKGAQSTREIGELNARHAVVTVQGRTLIMNKEVEPRSGLRDITLSTEADFRARYRNRRINVHDGNRVRMKPLADHWLAHPGRRQYDGFVFDPGAGSPDNLFNLWQGFAVEPAEGDCELFLEHVRENICGGDETLFCWVLAWMADAVQNPTSLPGTAIVLRGRQGTGKSFFGAEFGRLFGPHFKHLASSHMLTGNFNAHLKDALVVFADEAFWAGEKSAEGTLKGMITEQTRFVEYKGKDAFPIDNFVRLIMASNHDWVVAAGTGERRFLVLDVGEARIQDHAYFAAIAGQMDRGGREALLHRLLNHDLSGVNLRQIPATEALLQQKLHTLEPVERWLFDRLSDGSPISRIYRRWDQPIEKRHVQNDYIGHAVQSGIRRRSDETQLGIKLKKLLPRLNNDARIGPGRARAYLFPPLAECRQRFEALLGQTITWPEEPEVTDAMPSHPDNDVEF
jgi:hypothetical protein